MRETILDIGLYESVGGMRWQASESIRLSDVCQMCVVECLMCVSWSVRYVYHESVRKNTMRVSEYMKVLKVNHGSVREFDVSVRAVRREYDGGCQEYMRVSV